MHLYLGSIHRYCLTGRSERSKSGCTLSLLQALQLLNFLIVDCSDNLREAISRLDPFPDTTKFKQINKRYKQIRKDRTSLREVFIVIVSTLLTTVKWSNGLLVGSSRFPYQLGIERFDVTPANLEVGSVDPCITNSIFYRNQLDVTFLRLFVFFFLWSILLVSFLCWLTLFSSLCFVSLVVSSCAVSV